jgi:3-hydroxybutyryl-CoA dehydrogenase
MRVAVIGAGTMGNGIAQVFAQHGHAVRLIDVSAEALNKGLETIRGSLARLVKKQAIGAAAVRGCRCRSSREGRALDSRDLRRAGRARVPRPGGGDAR